MNEKIKELADQASQIVRQEHPELAKGMTMWQIGQSVKVMMVTEYDLEKFAKLIILECARVAVLPDVKHNNDIADIQGAFNAGRTHASIEIQEHFDIEE